ncbi:MAG TPA: hypothetical protein VHC48_19065, partial [Puia sp.]|nr:hypothetical protein [Puia sp.]
MRIIVVFAALLWTAPVFAYAGRNVREGGDPRMIAFTALHSVKIELTGATAIGTGVKFSVRIVDERGGKVVFDQPVTGVSK